MSDLDRILQDVDREDLLLWLLEHDSRKNVTLALHDPVAIAELPETTGRELAPRHSTDWAILRRRGVRPRRRSAQISSGGSS